MCRSLFEGVYDPEFSFDSHVVGEIFGVEGSSYVQFVPRNFQVFLDFDGGVEGRGEGACAGFPVRVYPAREKEFVKVPDLPTG